MKIVAWFAVICWFVLISFSFTSDIGFLVFAILTMYLGMITSVIVSLYMLFKGANAFFDEDISKISAISYCLISFIQLSSIVTQWNYLGIGEGISLVFIGIIIALSIIQAILLTSAHGKQLENRKDMKDNS